MIDGCNETAGSDYEYAGCNEPSFAAALLPVIQLYYMPALVVLGCVGNTLSVFVFFGTKLRKLSSSYYLSALAVSDTGFLVAEFITWLNLVNVPLFKKSGFCQLAVYGSHICSFLSVWLVVLFTVERFIAVRYPLHRPVVCTVSRAKIFICCLTFIALPLYSPYFVIAAPQFIEETTSDNQTVRIEMCSLVYEWRDLATALNHVDFFLTLVLPFIIIVTLNTLICRTVHQLARVRRTMTIRDSRRRFFTPCQQPLRARRYTDNNNTIGRTYSHRTNSHSQNKVTQMLLVVSTVFICLNLPSYLLRIWVYLIQPEDESSHDNEVMGQLQHYSNILFATNFGINFVLYCISGQNFRKSLCTLFRSRRPLRGMHEHTQATVLSEYCRPAPLANSVHRRKLTYAGTSPEVQKSLSTAVLAADSDATDLNGRYNIIITTTAQ